MTKQERAQLIDRLIPLIDDAMLRDKELRREAIVEGRIGLDEMDDYELAEFASDCWGLDVIIPRRRRCGEAGGERLSS